jgi:prolyl-tRNA synthetase
MEDDFARWYTDIVKKADLCDYSSVRGCMIIRPYGFAIWELIRNELDRLFKKTGHENVYMPMFIPESLLQREKDHVDGFAPEVAWVTHGGEGKLAERLCVRPTSETLFCEHYANIISSYRDLPKLYNQWCSVVRWEKTTRPFLRTTEFLWQEGHTAHADAEEALAETERMLGVYADLCERFLAIPVVKGRKTEREKFAGAERTYSVESIMRDGKALQTATSHYFGDGFAKAFDITYTDKDNRTAHVHQTSWGATTRLIGALIMVHGDNSGLKLPPLAAPTQVVIIPVAQHKEGVEDAARNLFEMIKSDLRIDIDLSDHSPGWKFSQYEMKGVPLRVEIGPREVEENSVVMVRRDTGEKISASSVDPSRLVAAIRAILDEIQSDMFNEAKKFLRERIYDAAGIEEFGGTAENKPGFIRAMWCGNEACEAELKERFAVTSRCLPFEDNAAVAETCVCCGKPADKLVYWGKAY